MQRKYYFNEGIFKQMINDKMVMNFDEFLSKYVPEYVKSQELQNKMKELNENPGTVTRVELDILFQKAVFLSMPIELMSEFVNQIPEDKKDICSDFIKLCYEFYDLKESFFDINKFLQSSDIVQVRAIDQVPSFDYQKYLQKTSKEVQNEIFLQMIEKNPEKILENSFSPEVYLQNEEVVTDIIPPLLQKLLQEKMDLLGVVEAPSILKRISDNIFKKLPDEFKLEVIDQFIEKELEVIESENLSWEQIEKNLTGEELLELLNAHDFKQKEGESFHLNFDSINSNLDLLVKVSQKYKLSCSLTVKSCDDLPIESIKILQNHFGIKIDSVRFKHEDLNDEQKEPYKIEDYIRCRKIIDIMTRDIDVSEADFNKEKKVCGILCYRLSHLARYNNAYIQKSHMKQTTKEEDVNNRNLIGVLLNGTCVCDGYAEAFRNLALCSGLEARYVGAYNKEARKSGHSWNLAKLDGEWYNLDVTWDADRIVKQQEPKYFLKSDWEFGHNDYIREVETPKCEKSVKNPVAYYLPYGSIEKNLELNRLLRRGVADYEITDSEVNYYEEQRDRIIAQNNNDLQK